MTEAGRDADWNFLSRYQYQLRAVFGQGRGREGVSLMVTTCFIDFTL